MTAQSETPPKTDSADLCSSVIMEGEGTVSVENFEDPSNKGHVPNSPRTVEACRMVGVQPSDLLSQPFEAFKDPKIKFESVQRHRYKNFERRRAYFIKRVKECRETLVKRPRGSSISPRRRRSTDIAGNGSETTANRDRRLSGSLLSKEEEDYLRKLTKECEKRLQEEKTYYEYTFAKNRIDEEGQHAKYKETKGRQLFVFQKRAEDYQALQRRKKQLEEEHEKIIQERERLWQEEVEERAKLASQLKERRAEEAKVKGKELQQKRDEILSNLLQKRAQDEEEALQKAAEREAKAREQVDRVQKQKEEEIERKLRDAQENWESHRQNKEKINAEEQAALKSYESELTLRLETTEKRRKFLNKDRENRIIDAMRMKEKKMKDIEQLREQIEEIERRNMEEKLQEKDLKAEQRIEAISYNTQRETEERRASLEEKQLQQQTKYQQLAQKQMLRIQQIEEQRRQKETKAKEILDTLREIQEEKKCLWEAKMEEQPILLDARQKEAEFRREMIKKRIEEEDARIELFKRQKELEMQMRQKGRIEFELRKFQIEENFKKKIDGFRNRVSPSKLSTISQATSPRLRPQCEQSGVEIFRPRCTTACGTTFMASGQRSRVPDLRPAQFSPRLTENGRG